MFVADGSDDGPTAERLKLLGECSRAFSEAIPDEPALLQLVAERIAGTTGAACAVWLPPAADASLEVAAAHCPIDQAEAGFRQLAEQMSPRVDGALWEPVLEGRKTVHVTVSPETASAGLSPGWVDLGRRHAMRRASLAPLLSRGRLVGALSLFWFGGDGVIRDGDDALVTALGDCAAPAIDNARLLADARRQAAEHAHAAERLKLLSEAARHFAAATGDHRALLDRVATRLGELLGESCVIRLVAEDGDLLESPGAIYHEDPDRAREIQELLSGQPQRVGEGIMGRVAQTGKTLLVPVVSTAVMVQQTAERYRAFTERAGISSLLAVPLLAAGRVLGVAVLIRSRSGNPYTIEDQMLLEDLAAHAALAILNSRLLLSVQRELAERKRAEEELRQSEAKFLQAQKMEAVGRLAGGVAHDFNNVLTVVLSYSDMVMSQLRPDEPMHGHVEEIHRAGQRAASLTRQLLAFSRRQVLEPRVVNFNRILTGVEKMLRRLLGEDVELTLLLQPDLANCRVDPGQIEQVLLNLAVNARDAMPEGGKLTIETHDVVLDEAYTRTHPEVSPGPFVVISVTDTGLGMNRETQARLFEPFYTTKPVGVGTGLGLATVYGIVKQSGGSIWVYSESKKGTTFKLYFPRVTGAEEQPATSPRPATPARGTETVMVVEDEEPVRLLVATVLRRAGYHVLEAGNGGEALLICEQHGGSIHLLLTDVVMPRLSGRQLAERLRPVRPDMRVLYMSGYTENAIVHHGVLDSGIHFLPKPILPDDLLKKVRQVLDA